MLRFGAHTQSFLQHYAHDISINLLLRMLHATMFPGIAVFRVSKPKTFILAYFILRYCYTLLQLLRLFLVVLRFGCPVQSALFMLCISILL